MKNITIIACALACLTTPAKAQSKQVPAADCPAQYELIAATLCMKFSTGDIVLPDLMPATPRDTIATCRKGYEILVENQCMNSGTGDIVFAQANPVGESRTAKK